MASPWNQVCHGSSDPHPSHLQPDQRSKAYRVTLLALAIATHNANLIPRTQRPGSKLLGFRNGGGDWWVGFWKLKFWNKKQTNTSREKKHGSWNTVSVFNVILLVGWILGFVVCCRWYKTWGSKRSMRSFFRWYMSPTKTKIPWSTATITWLRPTGMLLFSLVQRQIGGGQSVT